MSITSKDIARICGVSRGTVDRALNNKPRIDPKTKEKILKVARELNYRPDLVARSLAKGETMSIGVVVFDIRNRYFAQLVNAIEKEAKKYGYLLNITLQEKDPEMEIKLIDNLVARRVDGLIICPVNKSNNFEKYLKNLKVPLIVAQPTLHELCKPSQMRLTCGINPVFVLYKIKQAFFIKQFHGN